MGLSGVGYKTGDFTAGLIFLVVIVAGSFFLALLIKNPKKRQQQELDYARKRTSIVELLEESGTSKVRNSQLEAESYRNII